MVMAAVTYISLILNGMMMLAMIFQTISRGIVSAKRLEKVLLTDSAIRDGAGTEEETDGKNSPYSVEFLNVSFCYPGYEKRVLQKINLKIKKGETLAIIGATGSGKTSLINLIPRFYDVSDGTVRVNGCDVRRWKKHELRDKITVCLQKSELFSGTIRENILLGRKDASNEEVEHAARNAQAEEFILQQPDGYETEVSQGGMSLSGGQRQRIAISRALLRGSEILIFDDATSALDLKTEAAFYRALSTEYKDATKIMIAQRIASVRGADRIAVLDKGRIVGCADHEELLRTCEVYRDIYASQQKGGVQDE